MLFSVVICWFDNVCCFYCLDLFYGFWLAVGFGFAVLHGSVGFVAVCGVLRWVGDCGLRLLADGG